MNRLPAALILSTLAACGGTAGSVKGAADEARSVADEQIHIRELPGCIGDLTRDLLDDLQPRGEWCAFIGDERSP
jgi:hypothetical protein